jgi:hypothetical protein
MHMHTINLLIANSNFRVTNMIEALVRGVCTRETSLHSSRVSGVDEFLTLAVRDELDLIIVNPENLSRTAQSVRPLVSVREAENAIRSIKTLRSAPIIAVAVSPEHELALSEAGADLVLGLPFNCGDLKSAIARLIILPESQSSSTVVRPSFVSAFFRGVEQLTRSFSFSKS